MTTAAPLTAKFFFEKTLNKRQSYQAHFIEICQRIPHQLREQHPKVYRFNHSDLSPDSPNHRTFCRVRVVWLGCECAGGRGDDSGASAGAE